MKWLVSALRALGGFLWKLVKATVNAIYKTITRTALYLATAWLVIYFGLNSTFFNDELMTLLGDVLPGQFSAEALQWGPRGLRRRR